MFARGPPRGQTRAHGLLGEEAATATSPASPATTKPPAWTAAGHDRTQDARGRVPERQVERETRRHEAHAAGAQRNRPDAPKCHREPDQRGPRRHERHGLQPSAREQSRPARPRNAVMVERLPSPGSPKSRPTTLSSAAVSTNNAGAERGHGRRSVGRTRCGSGAGRWSSESPSRAGTGPIVGAVHRPRDPLDRGFPGDLMPHGRPAPAQQTGPGAAAADRRRRVQRRVLAAAPSPSSTPPSRSTTARCSPSTSPRCCSRVLAYRGRRRRPCTRGCATPTWSPENRILHFPTLLRRGGGSAASSTRTATDGSRAVRPRWTPGH